MPLSYDQISAMGFKQLIENLDPFTKINQGNRSRDVIEEQYLIAQQIITHLSPNRILYSNLNAGVKASLYINFTHVFMQKGQNAEAEKYYKEAVKYCGDIQISPRKNKLTALVALLGGCLQRECRNN